MANKKKRNRPRPPSGPRPAAKPPGQPNAAKPSGPAKASSSSSSTTKAPSAAAKGGGAAKSTKPQRERTGPTRAERLAAAEAARRRRRTRNRALIVGAIVGVLTLITVTVINSRRSNSAVISALESSGACSYDTRADDDDGAGRNHVSGNIDYEVDPPSGGNHNPSAARPGVYTQESAPPDGEIVHAHEHGYVTLWYRPDLAGDAVDQLRDVADEYDRDTLVVPRESLSPSEPVAATAWNKRLICSRVDTAALERFITEFRNEGPEKVPH
ncbi:MAG TPA: DUF3105 domain-containing protein [Acidimicrobiales bacterium]|nr:DUF3105 domain-containing protein [Acidimicrobiales bacterium]